MARPRKTGLDYFPFDCDFFEDEKIVAIAGEFGIKGEMAAIKLLCAIYRNGYYIEWSEMLRLKLLRQMPGVSAELFDQILNRLVRWGFFDASLFDSVKVLTSVGIQRRYFEATRLRLKGNNLKYILLPDVNKTGVSNEETPVSNEETPVSNEETPQIKVNENKNKKSPNGDQKEEGVIPGLEDKKPKRVRKKAEYPQPTLDEVIEYFRNHPNRPKEWEIQAKLFFSHYDAFGWKNAFGTPVERWDSMANRWIYKNIEQKENEAKQNDRFSGRRGVVPKDEGRKGFKGTL